MDTARRKYRSGRPLRVVIAGGGTGGHLFPAIAVAEEFMTAQPASRILFVSTGNAFERAALDRAGFPLRRIASEAVKGRGAWQILRALAKVPAGIAQSMGAIRKFRAHLVLGVGSYASGAVVLGAKLLRVPVVLHEQNLVPGITNRILAPLADLVCLSFEESGARLRTARLRVTGNPVRRAFLDAAAAPPKNAAGRPALFRVAIVGGSQGAHAINAAVMEALGGLENRQRYRFVHQTGPRDARQVREAYAAAGVAAEVRPFFHDLADRYRTADLVICRAGATTIAEVTALGKAAVFVPYPHAADDHQLRNARALAERGAARVIAEPELTGERLGRVIGHFADNPGERLRMGAEALKWGRPRAAADIVDACYGLVNGPRKRLETVRG